MKKGCGQLIHISDFIEEENGCLIVCSQEGVVQKDAQCITYPGSGSDCRDSLLYKGSEDDDELGLEVTGWV
jgi:hypothetical protein